MTDTENQNSISPDNIFIKIWTEPRSVFRYINETHFDRHVTILLILSGISRAFDRASLKGMGDKMSMGAVIGLCIIAGALFGWITYYIYAALLSWTGKWLDGEGDTKSILRILSYAMLPSIIALLFLLPQIIVYGNEVFKYDGDLTSEGLLSDVIGYGSMILEFLLAVWTIVLCVIGISEVQKLSIAKSILNLVLPAIVILLPLLVIYLIADL